MPKNTNPVKVIREKCLDCCCGQVNEVAACPCQACPLWPFRFGKNPYYKAHQYTEEERARKRETINRNREKAMMERQAKTNESPQGYTDTY